MSHFRVIKEPNNFIYFWKHMDSRLHPAKPIRSVFDRRLVNILQPITDDLIEISKGHKVSISVLTGERKGKFPKVNGISITIFPEAVKSKNPILSLVYKLFNKQHIYVKKDVITQCMTADRSMILSKSPKKIIQDVKKTLTQAVLEHENTIENDKFLRINNIFNRLTSRVKKLSGR